jgi:Ohr subfamily peroxiredoxin
MKIIYTARASANGGRSGHAQTDDGAVSVDLAMPGTDGKGTNPEQLFAVGYAACFDSALKLTAQRTRKAMTASRTTAEVSLAQLEGGSYGLDVDMHVDVQGLSESEATALVAAAHQVCPYSKALQGNVDVRVHVHVI